jgi:rubredoxin
MSDTSPEKRLIDDIESGKFRHVDGVMSPLTRRLLRDHGAVEVDMTEFWMMTSQDWCCPVCKRNKAEIVRKDKNGRLICRLVEHHDHMKDILGKRFSAISATLKGGVVADGAAERFAKRSSSMVSAYNNVVICQDCNNADASAKKAVGTPVDFSFSPGEIARFIIPSKNTSHGIDADMARQIWADAEETFKLRMKIADRIAYIAATNTHWFQEGSHRDQPEGIKIDCKISLGLFYDGLDGLPYQILRGKKSEVLPNHAGWRAKCPAKSGNVPTSVQTNGECDHVARVKDTYVWELVTEDWCCPVCNRKKREVIRLNKVKEWFFGISRQNYRDLASPRKRSQYIICNDCGLVARDMGREAARTAGLSSGSVSAWVTLEDISAVIKANPHTRHEIFADRAGVIVAKLVDIMRAEMPGRNDGA